MWCAMKEKPADGVEIGTSQNYTVQNREKKSEKNKNNILWHHLIIEIWKEERTKFVCLFFFQK